MEQILWNLLNLDEYDVGRYRSIGMDSQGQHIVLRSRIGGGNRQDYASAITSLRSHPWYIHDYDDDYDETYAFFVFHAEPPSPQHLCEDFESCEDFE